MLAPDSFKGTMSAQAVTAALAEGVTAAGALAVPVPLADGGEGTAEVLRTALGGQVVTATVTGPLGDPVPGWFLMTDGDDGATAVLDTATASGLALMPGFSRDAQAAEAAAAAAAAEAADTTGTGELLAAAAAAGARRILLGVGGSATTDGGAGALAAIEAAGGLRGARLTVLCDVRTPFERAAIVYGPQKGADPAAVERLTRRLHRLAAEFPRDPRGLVRTGAAGGLSGALWAVHGAELVPGIEAVLDSVGFDALLIGAAAVITGEGCLDAQTREGKVVAGVTRRCSRAGVPAWAVVGRSVLPADEVIALGLAGLIEAGDPAALSEAAHRIAQGVGGG